MVSALKDWAGDFLAQWEGSAMYPEDAATVIVDKIIAGYESFATTSEFPTQEKRSRSADLPCI